MALPRLALVAGEPAGIGPELCVRLAQAMPQGCHLVAFADPDTLQAASRALSLPLNLLDEDTRALQPGDLPLRPCANAVPVRFGQPEPANAGVVTGTLTAAADACLRGEYHGLVTGPVHKAAINAGGIDYSGTTGLLAAHAGREVVMMLANAHMRVALATTHLPLRDVADAINREGLTRSLRILHAALREDFAIADPRIVVLGLNPHAGEDGVLGREERDIIAPTLQALREEGMRLAGPLPADTAFLPDKLRDCDAVLAMYHDQGLPVLKYSDFARAVNITLGLPYPRVAVDHGTALDLAGKGSADPSSLRAAVETCARLVRARAVRN